MVYERVGTEENLLGFEEYVISNGGMTLFDEIEEYIRRDLEKKIVSFVWSEIYYEYLKVNQLGMTTISKSRSSMEVAEV